MGLLSPATYSVLVRWRLGNQPRDGPRYLSAGHPSLDFAVRASSKIFKLDGSAFAEPNIRLVWLTSDLLEYDQGGGSEILNTFTGANNHERAPIQSISKQVWLRSRRRHDPGFD